MNVLVLLIPVSLTLGGLGVVAFLWTLRSRQYDDPEGHAARILIEDADQPGRASRNTSNRSQASSTDRIPKQSE